MNNVWKGLAVGAVVGAVIGLVLDLLRGAGKGAAAVAELAREHGPDVIAAVASATGAGAERLRDADLPDKLRRAAHTAAASDTAHTIRDAANSAVAATTAAAKNIAAAASDATESAHQS
jgi:hypothetical protein